VLKRAGGHIELLRVVPLKSPPAGLALTYDGKLLVATADDQITKAEAKQIRARWEELKSVTEGFVAAAESGEQGAASRCDPAFAPSLGQQRGQRSAGAIADVFQEIEAFADRNAAVKDEAGLAEDSHRQVTKALAIHHAFARGVAR